MDARVSQTLGFGRRDVNPLGFATPVAGSLGFSIKNVELLGFAPYVQESPGFCITDFGPWHFGTHDAGVLGFWCNECLVFQFCYPCCRSSGICCQEC